MKRRALIAAVVAALVMSVVAGVVYGSHGGNSSTLMTLLDNKFNYLGLTGLSGGDSYNVSLSSLPSSPFTIQIANDDKRAHIVEFEKDAVEFKSPKIRGGQSGSLTVNLTAGEWLVYCPLHMKVKPAMHFRLNIVE